MAAFSGSLAGMDGEGGVIAVFPDDTPLVGLVAVGTVGATPWRCYGVFTPYERRWFRRRAPAAVLASLFAPTNQFDQHGGDVVQGQNEIDIPGFDRSLRHAEVL